MANLYDKAQYIFVAGANKSGSVYGLSPIAGTTNVTLVSASTYRLSSGSRTNSSGILENVNSHILRVDYSGTSSCPSYKFEPQRTNYLISTDYLSTASAWATNDATWSLATDTTSPLGTSQVALLRERVGGGASVGKYIRAVNSVGYFNPFNSGVTGTYTVSVYVKQSGSGADLRNVMLLPIAASESTTGTFFNLQGSGSIYSNVNTYVSGAFIEQLSNGWYRCSILVNGLSQTPSVRVYLTSGSSSTNDFDYSGTGRGSLYLCAAQLESGSAHGTRDTPSISAGTYVTSYMSSSAAAGTRTADRMITLPSSSNSSAWTYFMAFKRLSPDINGTNFDFIITSGSGTTQFAGLYNNGIAIWNSGSQGSSGSSLPIGVEHKAAIRFNNGVVTWFINGSQRFSINWPVNTFTGKVLIGDQDTGNTGAVDITHRSSFYVRTGALFNQSLTNAECTSLTATGSGTV